MNIVNPPIKNINQMVLVNRSRMQEEQRIGRGMRSTNARLRVNTFVVSQSNETQFATWRTEYISERQQKQMRCEDVTESHSSLDDSASFAMLQLKSNVQKLLARSQLQSVQLTESDDYEVGVNEESDIVIHEDDIEEEEDESQKKKRKLRLIDTGKVQFSKTDEEEPASAKNDHGFEYGVQDPEDSDCSECGDVAVAPGAPNSSTIN